MSTAFKWVKIEAKCFLNITKENVFHLDSDCLLIEIPIVRRELLFQTTKQKHQGNQLGEFPAKHVITIRKRIKRRFMHVNRIIF